MPRRTCVASRRSTYFPCCFIHVVEHSSRGTLTRDLVGSPSATCSAAYDSELNSVDCTPPGGCRTDLLSKYAGPDMLAHYSDAGYVSLLTPLALLPAETHARKTLRALIIGGGAGELATTLAAHLRPLLIDVPDASSRMPHSYCRPRPHTRPHVRQQSPHPGAHWAKRQVVVFILPLLGDRAGRRRDRAGAPLLRLRPSRLEIPPLARRYPPAQRHI